MEGGRERGGECEGAQTTPTNGGYLFLISILTQALNSSHAPSSCFFSLICGTEQECGSTAGGIVQELRMVLISEGGICNYSYGHTLYPLSFQPFMTAMNSL